MNDKEYRIIKKKIERLVFNWRDKLGLGSYRLHHSWARETKDGADNCGAQVEMRWAYLEADFTWYLPALKELDDEELEEAVLHEFCHILVDPLMHEDSEQGKMVYERVTTTIQRAIMYVNNERIKDEKAK